MWMITTDVSSRNEHSWQNRVFHFMMNSLKAVACNPGQPMSMHE